MKTFGAFEAKTNFLELLDLVDAGDLVTITRRGKPVAMLVPFERQPALTSAEAAASLRALRKGVTLGDVGLRALIDEGRR